MSRKEEKTNMKKLFHFIRLAWAVSPMHILLLFVKAITNMAKTLLNILLPMFLINELTGAKEAERLLLFAGLIVLNNVGMTLLDNLLQKFSAVYQEKTGNGMMKLMSEKIMNLEYSYLENPMYLDLKERAVFAIQNQNAIENMVNIIFQVVGQAFTMVSMIVILATLGPVLIVVLVLGIVVSLLIYGRVSKHQMQVMQEIIPINRRFGYYASLAEDKAVQKDIRLYGMSDMITGRIMKFSHETCDVFENMQVRTGKAMGQMGAVNEFVTAFSYAYVGIRTISDALGPKLTIGALTMYVNTVVSFSNLALNFGNGIVNLMQFLNWLEPYLEFMTLSEETKETGKVPFAGEVETVEFKNVTFTYPNAEQPVLKNISFTIHKGEKISVVGLNGAGKSTLVKLICRMYKADNGEILINGRNIYEYEYLSYMKTISAVFQDYRLFNFTIAENISCQAMNASMEKIERLVDEVGLKEKVQELPNGIFSRFGKDYDAEGIEFSGGQGQKIAIARALYKDASMVILDEPASALDPIAEAEIYEKFNSLVEEKTAIYISHRMSSSVFCDRILIIDGGTVADFDTHENLMKKTESLYYKLFQSQAENYKLEPAV
ncbi:MAG: ABC transporter ATP-binding protein [Lachnospiraceae bacterium]|nr:ABC transporter ATP-binding protein [Lachnospiraceae bacterium]